MMVSAYAAYAHARRCPVLIHGCAICRTQYYYGIFLRLCACAVRCFALTGSMSDQEGTGTEIFPAYDNKRLDKDGEPTFSYYEGQYRDGQRYGKGVYISAEGDKYHGSLKLGLPDGYGTMVWASGDYISCNWKAGVPMSNEVKSVKFAKEAKEEKAKREEKTEFDDDREGGYGFEERAI